MGPHSFLNFSGRNWSDRLEQTTTVVESLLCREVECSMINRATADRVYSKKKTSMQCFWALKGNKMGKHCEEIYVRARWRSGDDVESKYHQELLFTNIPEPAARQLVVGVRFSSV